MTPRYLNDADSWLEHIPFGFLAVELCRPEVIVELGVHRGNSYCAFCQAVTDLATSTHCFGIDTWQGDPHAGTYGDNVLQALRAYHDPCYGAFSQLVQSTFDSAAERFEEGSVDLLHIDGLHTYEAVKHDFQTWLPKLTDSGIVLFHDTAERRDDFGVWKFWAEVSTAYPSFEFQHCKGLGVLGVGRNLPGPFAQFLESANAAPQQTRQAFVALGGNLKLKCIAAALFEQQSQINHWKEHIGKSVLPQSNQRSAWLADPLDLTRGFSADICDLIASNLQLRADAKKQMKLV